ncbi:DUF3465 domain-containing protein [Marinicella litoralis]|uniref:Uncharacterized protein DUF3465 n=1 Tax=Marinicella litoralis TaxID=644220 RepID=A0A4R6Y3R0_9GAMM|nr:DUF3465 domain-containing protein [Marinicella litoralis]TDR23718.1 uncharacterized protein DUF3465 [Marinicella litoralis]
MNKPATIKAKKKRLIQGAFLLVALVFSWWSQNQPAASNELEQVIEQQRSDVMVEFDAMVDRLLRDDNEGSRHQKFIVKSGAYTILVAHNIDLAPRVPIQKGDMVRIRGEYEWNNKGGVVHWTHDDPRNRHENGWIELNGKKFK